MWPWVKATNIQMTTQRVTWTPDKKTQPWSPNRDVVFQQDSTRPSMASLSQRSRCCSNPPGHHRRGGPLPRSTRAEAPHGGQRRRTPPGNGGGLCTVMNRAKKTIGRNTSPVSCMGEWVNSGSQHVRHMLRMGRTWHGSFGLGFS